MEKSCRKYASKASPRPLKQLSKMFFISSKKHFLVSRYSNFYDFFPSFPNCPDSKGKMKVEYFIMPWIDLHKFADVMFAITQKLLYITWSKLVR